VVEELHLSESARRWRLSPDDTPKQAAEMEGLKVDDSAGCMGMAQADFKP